MTLSKFTARCVGAAAIVLCSSVSAQVSLLSPNGGNLTVGQSCDIQWQVLAQQNTLNWDVYYSASGPTGPWFSLALDLPPGDTSVGAIHSWRWTVPLTPSNDVRVRVVQDNVATDHDAVSSASLTIAIPVASNTPFGRACGISTLIPVSTFRPIIGQACASMVTSVQPTAAAVFVFLSLYELPTPQSLQSIGLPGCTLYLTTDYAESVPHGNGAATWYAFIPNDPNLIGLGLVMQAVVLDPAINNPLRVAVTNGTRAVISNH